ncbi:type VI immunity family protein [Pseudomonas purpurea]|uniref:type VI immunity family protein n=1 Tax=Pseudomonas purpurea TaxID=3136737 RepID=UPI003266B960
MKGLEQLVERAPDLAFELPDGTPVVKLGLIATLYFKEGYTTQIKQKVMECFDRFYSEFGSELKAQWGERHSKLTPDSFKKSRDKILKTGPHNQYEWQISSAIDDKEAETYGLAVLSSQELHGDSTRSFIKLVLPWTFLEAAEGMARYRDWLVYLCNQVCADHGYGGLSTILPFYFDPYTHIECELAQQFSGLEVDSMPHRLSMHLVDQIKGANWYTILSDTFVERLGGETAVRQLQGSRSDIDVVRYDKGLIIRAGDYPQLGALADGLPAAYVTVSKGVKPLRSSSPVQLHGHSPYGASFGKDSSRRWYARFDEEGAETEAPC